MIVLPRMFPNPVERRACPLQAGYIECRHRAVKAFERELAHRLRFECANSAVPS